MNPSTPVKIKNTQVKVPVVKKHKGFAFEAKLCLLLLKDSWEVKHRVGIYDELEDEPGEIDIVATKTFTAYHKHLSGQTSPYSIRVTLAIEAKNTSDTWVFLRGSEKLDRKTKDIDQFIFSINKDYHAPADEREHNGWFWEDLIKRIARDQSHTEWVIPYDKMIRDDAAVEETDSRIYSAINSAVAAALELRHDHPEYYPEASSEGLISSAVVLPVVVTCADMREWEWDGKQEFDEVVLDKARQSHGVYKVKDIYTKSQNHHNIGVLVLGEGLFKYMLAQLNNGLKEE